MKSLVTAVIIAAAVVGGSWIYTAKIDSIAKEMALMNEEITNAAEQADFDTAQKTASDLNEYIKKNHTAVAAFMDHAELEKIEMNLTRLICYLNEKNISNSILYSKLLEKLIDHLPENYKVSVQNVL